MSKQRTIAIKPCPCCGGMADLITEVADKTTSYYIACMDQTCSVFGPLKRDAVTAVSCWNRRFKAVTKRNLVKVSV